MKNSILFYVSRVCLVIGIVILIISQFKSCNESKQLKQDLYNSSIQITSWKDKYNQQHLTTQKLVVSRNQLVKQFDSLKTGLKVKDRHIKELQILVSNTSGKFRLQIDTIPIEILKYFTETEYDTLYYPEYGLSFSYKDDWVDISGDLGISDSIQIDLVDSVVITQYTKRKGLKKELFIDVMNKNPYVTIQNSTSFKIQEKKTLFHIGPVLGGGYSIVGNRFYPFVGVGVMFEPLTLKIKK